MANCPTRQQAKFGEATQDRHGIASLVVTVHTGDSFVRWRYSLVRRSRQAGFFEEAEFFPSMVDRFHQALLLISMLILSWLGMLALHMTGHLIYAALSGAEVYQAQLHPLSPSAEPRMFANPSPLLVAWGGSIWGAAIPLLILWVVRASRPNLAYLATFFAGFCLVANGAHLAIGTFIPAGDARQLLWLGAPQWLLVGLGFPVMIAGIGLFNGLGKMFGMGVEQGRVNRLHAWGVTLAWIAISAVEFVLAR